MEEGGGQAEAVMRLVECGLEQSLFGRSLSLSLSLATSTGRRADLWQANLLTIHDAMPRLPRPADTPSRSTRQQQKRAKGKRKKPLERFVELWRKFVAKFRLWRPFPAGGP